MVPIGMKDTYMKYSVMIISCVLSITNPFNQRNEPSKPYFEQLSWALSGSSGYDSCETDCPHSFWHLKITFCANYLSLLDRPALFSHRYDESGPEIFRLL